MDKINKSDQKNKILKYLSTDIAKKKINRSIGMLKQIYPWMDSFLYLTISPPISGHTDQILFIAYLKENTYILSQCIQESIEYILHCEDLSLIYVINDSDLKRKIRNKRISLDDQKKIDNYQIKLNDFDEKMYFEFINKSS